MQRNWIGRSEGARVRFPVLPPGGDGAPADVADAIEVFTTRIDTIYGATFVLLAPEHPMVARFAAEAGGGASLVERANQFRAQDRMARLTGEIEKEGFDTGRTVLNPFTREPVPVWIANFVLPEYGTGAVMGVPAHDQRDFEFATKYRLPIKVVVQPEGRPLGDGRARGGVLRRGPPGRLGRVHGPGGERGRDPHGGRRPRRAASASAPSSSA